MFFFDSDRRLWFSLAVDLPAPILFDDLGGDLGGEIPSKSDFLPIPLLGDFLGLMLL
jgi:hypothetical protein